MGVKDIDDFFLVVSGVAVDCNFFDVRWAHLEMGRGS